MQIRQTARPVVMLFPTATSHAWPNSEAVAEPRPDHSIADQVDLSPLKSMPRHAARSARVWSAILCMLTAGLCLIDQNLLAAQPAVVADATGSAKPGAGSEAAAADKAVTDKSDPKSATDSNLEAAEVRMLKDRLSRLERDLAELRVKEGRVPANVKDQRLITFVELPFLGATYFGANTNNRYFAVRLVFINLTANPLIVKRDDLQLRCDGQIIPLKESLPQNMQFFSFVVGTQTFQLGKLKMPAQLKIPAAGSVSAHVVFVGLPNGNHIPQMTVLGKAGDQQIQVDVNALQKDQLGLTIERIGPRRSLGLVRIAGQLNSINVGGLVDELDQLAAARVARVVLSFEETATIVDQPLVNWLGVNTSAARQQGTETPFPPVPATIREIYLARVPLDTRLSAFEASYPGLSSRVYKTEADAVMYALSETYTHVKRDELLETLEKGSTLERAAALAGGGGRLPREELPRLLKLADDTDPTIQRAALLALGHFGEPAALDKLVTYVKKNAEPLSSAAVEGLAMSRYTAAHDALLKVLQNESPEAKKSIVRILARHPRPIWSDAIYEFLQDSRAGLNVEALTALVQVGHPKLLSILEAALEDKQADYRNQAFQLLVNRSDRESEDLAVRYALKTLEKDQPTPAMLTLLGRVKDPRAVPLILARLDGAANKLPMLQLLALLGNDQTATALLEKYPNLQSHEKAEVLRAIMKLSRPRFRELAAQALLTTDSTLIGAAVQGLQEEATPEAIALLTETLNKSQNPYTWSYVSNALGMLGTPEARAALLQARDSSTNEKRQYAVNALAQLRQRSPGFQYYYQGQALSRQKKFKEATAQYDLAIQLDPLLAEAYSSRADAALQLKKYPESAQDFAKAYELDPFNSVALTGMCIVTIIIDGNKHEEAIKKAEAGRERFSASELYLYNMGCVYGRAVEALKKQTATAERDKLIEGYQQTALRDLKKAVELGFDDLAWMKQDPDLAAFQALPDFQKIAEMKPGEGKSDESTEADSEDAADIQNE